MVNINKQKLTILQQNILRVLFRKSGVSLNQRQLANLLGVTPPAIIKALPLLEKLGFIKLNKDKETKRFSIELNKNNLRVMQLKRVDNLKQVYESDLADFLEKEYAGAIIILFGSYSRGDDLLNSDIDIAIIGRKKKDVNLENYEKFLERKIIINFYESSNKIHKSLKENLANGIVLAGGFEL
ncbi:MAG TPA: nucleotidyltransferase domain-containing protein [Candidatus Nanoarchaeia archaeon]|nr:nucleotidyltransferase domain-containing protein [Candidatus Nanoarchaeia archaeon]